ncbi:THAP-type domain-containing protein, partial [Aphis craccivora]
RTRLLPTAIPTEFGNYNETCIETTENDTTNKTIDDDSLPDASIVTSTPSKQNQSVSVACTSLSPCSLFESSSSSISISTQTTQVLTVNTPRKRKLKLEVQELRTRCNKLEKKLNICLKK